MGTGSIDDVSVNGELDEAVVTTYAQNRIG